MFETKTKTKTETETERVNIPECTLSIKDSITFKKLGEPTFSNFIGMYLDLKQKHIRYKVNSTARCDYLTQEINRKSSDNYNVLNRKTVKELKNILKKCGVKNYSKLNKHATIEKIIKIYNVISNNI